MTPEDTGLKTNIYLESILTNYYFMQTFEGNYSMWTDASAFHAVRSLHVLTISSLCYLVDDIKDNKSLLSCKQRIGTFISKKISRIRFLAELIND